MSKEVAEELKKDLLLADPKRQRIILQNVLKKYDQELAKTKMFNMIKQGTAGVGTLSLPNTLETSLQY
jgi:ABC-type Zn2+ transport system substrate-binding protein/surface adhesin